MLLLFGQYLLFNTDETNLKFLCNSHFTFSVFRTVFNNLEFESEIREKFFSKSTSKMLSTDPLFTVRNFLFENNTNQQDKLMDINLTDPEKFQGDQKNLAKFCIEEQKGRGPPMNESHFG